MRNRERETHLGWGRRTSKLYAPNHAAAPRIADVDVIEPIESATIQKILQMLEDDTLLGSETRRGDEGAQRDESGDGIRHVATK